MNRPELKITLSADGRGVDLEGAHVTPKMALQMLAQAVALVAANVPDGQKSQVRVATVADVPPLPVERG
jgi:hypothetical protein